jgi:hypothetical protein
MIAVSWSSSAKIDYWSNIEYLELEWSLSEVFQFMDKVDEVLELLIKQNIDFKESDFKRTFQVPIVKQITLFYKIENNTILLVRFWNNYKNPKKLKL